MASVGILPLLSSRVLSNLKSKDMPSTVIVPRKTRVFVSVSLSYIGKKVEVSFALKDEMDKPKSETRLSDI